MAGQHAKMLSLYRNIVRHARVYPSKNRERILREIRSEMMPLIYCVDIKRRICVLGGGFRKNAGETDPAKVDEQRQVALKGLEQLMMYTTMDMSSSNLSVTLEQNPMGQPAQK